ncbi:MAG: hypothetical protein AAF366_21365 [Pseudomonadota bacterium]
MTRQPAPPLSSTLNDSLGVRFRLSPANDPNAMSSVGPVIGGEVEDYEIVVMGFDYGDLTDEDGDDDDGNDTDEGDYVTTAGNDSGATLVGEGPRHKILTNEEDEVLLKIGTVVDDEAASQEEDDAGDDDDPVAVGDNVTDGPDVIDDEDGFDDGTLFVTGNPLAVTIPVMNMLPDGDDPDDLHLLQDQGHGEGRKEF